MGYGHACNTEYQVWSHTGLGETMSRKVGEIDIATSDKAFQVIAEDSKKPDQYSG